MDTAKTSATTPVKTDRGGRGQAATLILAGTFTIMAGATVAPAMPEIRAAFAGTPNVELLSGLVVTTPALAIALFAPLAGLLADRIGRKAALLLGIAAFAIGGSSGSYLPDLATILAGRVVLGIGVSLVLTSSVAMIGDLYEGVDRQRLISRQLAASSFGGVLFLLGGGLLAGLDWRVVFLIYLLGGVLAGPALVSLPWSRPSRTEPRAGRPARSGPPTEILAPMAAMLLSQAAFYTIPVQLPFLVEEHFGATAVASGALIAALTFTVGMVALRFAWVRRLAGEHTLVALSFLAIGAGFLVLYLAANVVTLVAGLLVIAAGLGTLAPNLNNWVVSVASAHNRGRYAGFLTTSLFLGQFVSPILTQPIVNAVGIQRMFAAIAIGTVPIAIAYYLGGRRARDQSPVR
jgi:MFS family permease